MTKTTTESLAELLGPPMAAAAAVDLSDAEAARAELERTWPAGGPDALALRDALVSAVEEGVICDRGGEAIRFSRLAKPGELGHDLSVDFVWMTGPGIHHRHPNGEINLCFAVEGDPRFDGHEEGWVTFAPGTTHVPSVTDGRMLIVYFLPSGAVEWIEGAR